MPPPTRAPNVNCKTSGQLTQTAEERRRRYSYKGWIYEALVEGKGGKEEQRDTSLKIKLFLGKLGGSQNVEIYKCKWDLRLKKGTWLKKNYNGQKA